jgi:uncharacterized Zn finger protein (UPF0148 family)
MYGNCPICGTLTGTRDCKTWFPLCEHMEKLKKEFMSKDKKIPSEDYQEGYKDGHESGVEDTEKKYQYSSIDKEQATIKMVLDLLKNHKSTMLDDFKDWEAKKAWLWLEGRLIKDKVIKL